MGRRPSSATFDLLHSLTPAERGYVRKALAHPLGRKAGSMLALYDVIITSRDPDDVRITEYLRTQPGGGSQLKRILFDQVLRLLRTLRADASDRSRVTALMEEAAMLIDRELDNAAADRLHEADAICDRAHLFTFRSEVLNGLIRVARRGTVRDERLRVPDLLAERHRMLRIAHDLAVLGQCSASLLSSIQSPDRRAIAAEMLTHPLVADDRSADHVRIRFWQHHIRAMAYHMRGEIDAQDRELLAMMDIMREHPVFLSEDVAITVLANVLTTNIQRRDVASGRTALAMLTRISTTVPRLLDDLWYNGVRSELYLDLLEGKAHAIIEAEARVNDGVKRYPTHGAVVQRTWRMLCASAYLQIGDPTRALAMIRTILDEQGLPDTHYIAPRCIEIMALIDGGDVEPALYRLRSLERSFEHTKEQRPFLHAFVRAAKAIATGGRTERSAVRALEDILRRGINEPPDRAHRVTIDVDRWLLRHT